MGFREQAERLESLCTERGGSYSQQMSTGVRKDRARCRIGRDYISIYAIDNKVEGVDHNLGGEIEMQSSIYTDVDSVNVDGSGIDVYKAGNVTRFKL